MRVYLAGGMNSGWQDKVPEMEGVYFIDPRKDSPQNGAMLDFVTRDLELLKSSDLVFMYMELDNPSGYGATWECAVARENNIPIITVWEKHLVDPFVSCHSLFVYTDFTSGLKRLVQYLKNKGVGEF